MQYCNKIIFSGLNHKEEGLLYYSFFIINKGVGIMNRATLVKITTLQFKNKTLIEQRS